MATSPVSIHCAWCERVLLHVPDSVEVSHGICASCTATVKGLPIEDLHNAPNNLLDALPFGLIHIQGDGRVLQYNQAESRISGLAPEKVVGRNFFREIAPCTSVESFYGVLEKMRRAQESGRRQFQFLFRFSRQEVMVTIVLVYDSSRDEGILLVKRNEENV